jgi:hypothetical protein
VAPYVRHYQATRTCMWSVSPKMATTRAIAPRSPSTHRRLDHMSFYSFFDGGAGCSRIVCRSLAMGRQPTTLPPSVFDLDGRLRQVPRITTYRQGRMTALSRRRDKALEVRLDAL